jgi:Uma2 family endonuclease
MLDISAMLPAALTIPDLTEAEFLDLCQKFPDDLLEYTPEGMLLIMPPTDPETGARNAIITAQLSNWADVHGGIVVGPDGGFRLPGGSRRSPDASWFDAARWTAAKRPGTRFPSFAPEFAIELRSPDDRLSTLKRKMVEYLNNGVQLGWLIDPQERTVTIYRPGEEPEVLTNPASVPGEGPVAGFQLKLDRVFA